MTSALVSVVIHIILDNFGDRPDLTPFYGWMVPVFLMTASILYVTGRICRD
jgi:hypothetical protein